MEVEARDVEGPIIGVTVGGFEVARGVEFGRVPETATEVGKEREFRPELRDLADEDGVLVYGSECVVESVLFALNRPRGSVNTQLRFVLHGRRLSLMPDCRGFSILLRF
ncbi:hypothetical protein SLA2020_221300 [Shorea laevis]